MNIYLILNTHNIKIDKPPYLYIGSDSKDRVLLEQYSGSSKHLNQDIDRLGIHNFEKTLLWSGSPEELNDIGFDHLTELERHFHLWFDVSNNPLFYNLVIAGEEFNTIGKAVYYNKDDITKETILLPTNDLRVLSGEYIGRNSGVKASDDTIAKLKVRPHPSHFIDWSAYTKGHKKKCTINYKKPKSELHKQNMRKPKNKTACPHCGLMCAPNVFQRHVRTAHGAD